MSIFTVTKGGDGKGLNYREMIMTDASDLPNLPTSTPNSKGEIASIGSKAYTQDGQHFYVLGTDGVWREVPTGGGGGSYELPIATQNRLGGIMIGNCITAEDDGTTSVDLDAVAEGVTDDVTQNVIDEAGATDKEVEEAIEEVFG